MNNLLIVRGGGDLATGTIYKLHKCGFPVLVLEVPRPSAIRRNAAFSEAVYEGIQTVEDVTCYLADSIEAAEKLLAEGKLTMLTDPKGESIARLSNMLGGGVIVQRFGDLIRGRRSNPVRIEEAFITPTLNATPGDLSLVLPKRILDGIIEMIYALDKVAPGTANDDTLLYGVEVKFYNMEVAVDENLESCYKGLYIIGDGSGITHSLSHASASGVHVARNILNMIDKFPN